MSRFSPSSHASSVPFDEAVEAREYEEFFRQQDLVHVAAVDWHTRWERGLSAAEQAEFQLWLNTDPAHAAAYAHLDDGMMVLHSASAQQTQHMAQGRPSCFNHASGQFEHVDRNTARRQKSVNVLGRWSSLFGLSSRRNWFAFCFVAFLAVGIGWHQWGQGRFFSTQYAVKRGQSQTIALPDGSVLVLDAETQAKVIFYRDRREVRIKEGQVMFSVAPDRDSPFQVLVGRARVTVVGTRFSVRYRQTGMDADTVNVAVEEGHVRVADVGGWFGRGAGAEVNLVAGQGLSMAADGHMGKVSAVAPGSIALWRKGLVHFENTSLGDALVELERYGSTGLVVRDPAVAAMPIGGSFQVTRPDEFARMVRQILPVRLVPREAGKFEITLQR